MKGFTFLELTLVIALISILTAVATPFMSSFLLRGNGRVASDRIVSEIYKAESYTINSKSIGGNVTWGVCLTGQIFRLFNGSCNTPNLKEDYRLPNNVNVSGIGSITFSNIRGEPSSAVTIIVNDGITTKNIVINAVGMVEVN